MLKIDRIDIAQFIVLAVIAALVASILGYRASFIDFPSFLAVILASVATFVALSRSLFKYLNRDDNSEKVKQTTIISEKTDLNSGNTGNTKTPNEDTADEELNGDYVNTKNEKSSISSSYSYTDAVSLKRGDTLRFFRSSEYRIKKEIKRLNRGANINLAVGVIIAVIGVVGLFWYIIQYTDAENSKELALLIVHWVTRLSLITIVEIFAFFFLKMYRNHLQSIRYFQDELTSIESRKIAMVSSVIHENPEDISKSIEILLNIDRNFKMDSNQTTVDLEKLKTENSFIKAQMEYMLDVFKGILPLNNKKEGKE